MELFALLLVILIRCAQIVVEDIMVETSAWMRPLIRDRWQVAPIHMFSDQESSVPMISNASKHAFLQSVALGSRSPIKYPI